MKIPEGYASVVEAMAEAAQRWVREHPFAGPLQFTDFEKRMAERVGRPNERVPIIAILSDVVDDWAANADTRSFLQALVTASNGEATFMQARVLVDHAVQRMLERGSGKLPDGKARTCIGCGERQDGFTQIDGDPEPPGPGAIGLCARCGTLQRVSADGAAYEALSKRTFNQLPKSARKTLLSMKRGVEERNAREKRCN